jgi:hypothetical protein
MNRGGFINRLHDAEKRHAPMAGTYTPPFVADTIVAANDSRAVHGVEPTRWWNKGTVPHYDPATTQVADNSNYWLYGGAALLVFFYFWSK